MKLFDLPPVVAVMASVVAQVNATNVAIIAFIATVAGVVIVGWLMARMNKQNRKFQHEAAEVQRMAFEESIKDLIKVRQEALTKSQQQLGIGGQLARDVEEGGTQ